MLESLLGEWAAGREWAVQSFLALSGVALLCVAVRVTVESQGTTAANGKRQSGVQPTTAEFRRFQRSYLSVYVVIMLADWLQGTHMYTLYSKYAKTNESVKVGTLFFTGFIAAGLLGTFTGPLVDRRALTRRCRGMPTYLRSPLPLLPRRGH